MSFCPQCGAPASPGLSFCTACGRTLAPGPATPAPQPALAPAEGAAAARPSSGPAGKTVEPWVVVLLGIVTFGIYPLVLWWRASREVDAFTGSRSHPVVRIGVLLSAVALALMAIVIAMTFGTVFAAVMADPESPPDADALSRGMVESPLYLAAAVVQVAGAVTIYAGLHKTWSALQAEETRRGRQDPVRPQLFAGIGLASALVGVVSAFASSFLGTTEGAAAVAAMLLGFVGFALSIALFWVMYATQKHLNELWRAASAGWG